METASADVLRRVAISCRMCSIISSLVLSVPEKLGIENIGDGRVGTNAVVVVRRGSRGRDISSSLSYSSSETVASGGLFVSRVSSFSDSRDEGGYAEPWPDGGVPGLILRNC